MKKTAAMLTATVIVFIFPMFALAVEGDIHSKDLHLVLNGYAASADAQIGGILRDLKIISITDEVKGGKWEAIKPLLTELNKDGVNAAAVWFALPDGSYYTVKDGLTPENLSDRPYFPKLMSGRDVVGELLISKSTGKRSAVVAVPVMNNGKAAGALGVSISSENMSAAIDSKLNLPENMLFYALDEKGQVSLHLDSSLLHVFPSDLGSETLNDAVREMLSRQEGEVTYQFRGRKEVVFKKSALTGWTYAIGVVTEK